MKKILQIFLLLTVMFAAGVSAWGETTTLLEYGTNNVPWTESNYTDFKYTVEKWQDNGFSSSYSLDETLGPKIVTQRALTAEAVATISPSSRATLNIDATFFLKSNTGKNFAAGTASYFRIGNIWILENAQDCKSNYLINGTFSSSNVGTTFHSTSAGGSSVYRTTGISYRLVAEINTASNKLVSLSVFVNGDENASLSLSDVDLVSPDYTTFAFGLSNSAKQTNNNNIEALKSIVVTETPPSETYADYIVHFVDNNGDTVKDDEVRSGQVGTTAEANSVDQTPIYSGEVRYVYSSDGGGVEVTSAGDAELTITYTKSTKEAYSVMAQVGGTNLVEIASGTAFFDEGSTTEYWSKYINVGDTWYVTDTYGLAITSATNNVAFTAATIDYFFEFENMTISRTYGDDYTGTSVSNGRAKTLYGDANAYTNSKVDAGVYSISIDGKKWQDGYDDYFQIAYSTDQTNWVSLGEVYYAAGEEGVRTLDGAIIPTDGYIRIWTTGGSKTPRRYLDYMTLKKTADLPSTEKITVTSAGYATYVSDYNLDFTSANTKAYKVAVESKGVATLAKVDQVPAKTPVLLYCDGGNGEGEDVTITTDAVDAVTGNDLVAGTGGAVATIDGNYTNMILNNVDGIGFYYAAGQTVAKNRAYLHILTTLAPDAESTTESRMRFVFGDGEATGIESVATEQNTFGKGIYTLSGQRVSVPAKGLYIIDGKKVLVK